MHTYLGKYLSKYWNSLQVVTKADIILWHSENIFVWNLFINTAYYFVLC